MTDTLDSVPRDKFVFFHDGDFHPVTNMWDNDGDLIDDPKRAFRAVIYLGPAEWLATRVSPGEIERRDTVEARLNTKLRRIE
jgi:hypothetical protein